MILYRWIQDLLFPVDEGTEIKITLDDDMGKKFSFIHKIPSMMIKDLTIEIIKDEFDG